MEIFGLIKADSYNVEKKCIKCNENKSTSEFYKNKSRKDGFSNYCKACKSFGEKESLLKSKIWYNEWKQEQGCLKCKENRPYVLDMHHIDSNRKGDQYKLLSRMISSGTYSFESRKKRILKEAKKCVILCSNCHREFHHFERENNINIQDYINK